MRIGIQLDLRNPPSWRRDPARLHAFVLELIEHAEHVGVDSVWITEHHGFEDGYVTQPLTFLAAAAARTKRIRLGTGIMLAPLHSAVQIAEQAALVDLLSDGRLELGLGPGYRPAEFELYGADFDARRPTTLARIEQIRAVWKSSPPAPVQADVPIWVGFNGPLGARRVGARGERLLSLNPELVEPYREGLASAGHVPAVARMSGPVYAFVTDDPERDWPTVARHLSYEQDSYRRHMVEGTDQPTPRPIDPERYRARGLGFRMGNFLFGTPEHAAAELRAALSGVPADTAFVMASIAGMPEDLALRHVETLGTRLRPLVADLGTLGPTAS